MHIALISSNAAAIIIVAISLIGGLAIYDHLATITPPYVYTAKNTEVRDALTAAGYTIEKGPVGTRTAASLKDFLAAGNQTPKKKAFVVADEGGREYWIKTDSGFLEFGEYDAVPTLLGWFTFNDTVSTNNGLEKHSTFQPIAMLSFLGGVVILVFMLLLAWIGQLTSIVETD